MTALRGRVWLENLLLVHLFLSVLCNVQIVPVPDTSTNFDYCSITCDGKKHTLCEYPQGGATECQSLTHGLKPNMKAVLLDIHNNLRLQVAMGKGDGGKPSSSNMVQLEWSDEAEKIAQRWADQCTEGGRRDDCRSLSNQAAGEQNVAVTNVNKEFDLYFFQKSTVISWFKTGVDFKVETLDSYVFDEKTAPFTRIVWALTDAIGCGFSYGKMNGTDFFKLVCNYYPAGNIAGKSVYEKGKPCSKCPYAQCNLVGWPGLCVGPRNRVYNRSGNGTGAAPPGPSDSFYTASIASAILVLSIG